MFSNEGAYKIDEKQIDYDLLLQSTFNDIARRHSLMAFIFCVFNDDGKTIDKVFSYDLKITPLLARTDTTLYKSISEYFHVYPKPHIHKISNEFRKDLGSINPNLDIGFHVFFVPFLYLNSKYLFLGFPKSTSVDTVPERLLGDLSDIVVAVHGLVQYEHLRKFLEVLQYYVKEVGHDISSSVQATIAKLRNIERGVFAGEIVKEKAREAEDEILGTYRIAENLGFTVDPEYNIREGKYFNIIEAIRTVIDQYRSEAMERHITIKLIKSEEKIEVFGDDNGLMSAVGQLLFNAIKYAFGSSYIKVAVTRKSDDVQVTVIDRGTPLNEDELDKIWDFGYRGRNAYEKHVNGAGIGLYTVKKIVSAHQGRVLAHCSARSPQVAIFSFLIPAAEVLEKSKLL